MQADPPRSDDVENLPPPSTMEVTNVPPPSAPPPAIKKQPKTKITFEMYQSISTGIATMLRRKEDAGATVTWKGVISWYLSTKEDSIKGDVGELDKQRRLCHSVLKKLVRSDGILVFLAEREEGQQNDDNRPIGVHPNYAIE